MKLPILFKANSEALGGISTNWQINSYETTAQCCIPPEFNGPGGGFSPEDLFAQALTNCLIATFKVYAENSKLTFKRITINTDMKVDQTEEKKIIMKDCFFKIEIDSPSSIEKAQLLIKKAFSSGFILNSVKTELNYTLIINE